MKSFLALLFCLLLVNPAAFASSENELESKASFQAFDMISSMMQNEDLYSSRRLQMGVQINECLDATEWFPWEDQNQGENYFRLYFECECSGDFGSKFQLVCTLNDHCFTADDGVTEQCVTRTHSYDFSVDAATGFISTLDRFERVDSFLKNFPVTGNFTYVNPIPCSRAVASVDDSLSLPEAVGICTNATACQSFLANASYTDDDIEYLCPFISFNGENCQAFELGDCKPVTNDTFYSAMPDCSNVNSCMASSCQEYPVIDTSPERQLYRYPECSSSSEAPSSAGPTDPPSTAAFSSVAVSLMLVLKIAFLSVW